MISFGIEIFIHAPTLTAKFNTAVSRAPSNESIAWFYVDVPTYLRPIPINLLAKHYRQNRDFRTNSVYNMSDGIESGPIISMYNDYNYVQSIISRNYTCKYAR